MKLWISTDGNGGYDIGQGDVTIASVLASSDIPRPMIPFDQEHDPRALALLFKAAPDLLAAAVRAEGLLNDWNNDVPLEGCAVLEILLDLQTSIAKARAA